MQSNWGSTANDTDGVRVTEKMGENETAPFLQSTDEKMLLKRNEPIQVEQLWCGHHSFK